MGGAGVLDGLRAGTPLLGGLTWAGLSGVGESPNAEYAATVPHLAFMTFQMMFAVITPALISGAFAGRMRFRVYMLFILLWGRLVYDPIAHWVWGTGGWLQELGVLDFAGGHGRPHQRRACRPWLRPHPGVGPGRRKPEHKVPHNVTFVDARRLAAVVRLVRVQRRLGADVGGPGEPGLRDHQPVSGGRGRHLGAARERLKKRTSGVGAAVAAVVGLVAITPAAGFVTPLASVAIGSLAALACYAALHLLGRTRLDDRLDVFACHGVGGIVGALLTGVFATTSVNPAGGMGCCTATRNCWRLSWRRSARRPPWRRSARRPSC